jgi:starch synthase
MYSQRYGTPPLVSDVGGLHDTVVDIRENEETGTGLLFQPDVKEFGKALDYSLELFSSKDATDRIRRNGMSKDFSWTNVVKEYENLYSESL